MSSYHNVALFIGKVVLVVSWKMRVFLCNRSGYWSKFTRLQTHIIILNHHFPRRALYSSLVFAVIEEKFQKHSWHFLILKAPLGIAQLQFHSNFHFVTSKEQTWKNVVSEGGMVNNIVSVAKYIFHLETLNQHGRVGKLCDYSYDFFVGKIGKNIN